MPLADTLEKLYARRRFGIRPGVERVATLLERLGHPEQSFRSIHVVGTNGKGSTAAFLSSILTSARYRTGFFSSPHLVRFGERFRIDGREADDDVLAPLLDEVLDAAPPEATFFEIVTALAVLYFARSTVDIAVMEAGMGGRSDATAALAGIMTVITPISFDHCDYLGSTLAAIAAEKSGIARPGTPVVSAIQSAEARQVIAAYCAGNNNPLKSIDDTTVAWGNDSTLAYRDGGLQLSGLQPGISGRYQSQNAALALTAARNLSACGIDIPQEALVAGIAAARWPGRMEYVDGTPPLLLDGAHNPAGAAALAESLAGYRYSRLLLVTGVMEDKDVSQLLAPLAVRAARGFAVAPAIERALPAERLAEELATLGLETIACASVSDGISAARAAAQPGDLVLVCGSLFTVGEALAFLSGKAFRGIRG